MTERLYYTDSFLTEFEAQVLEAEATSEGASVVVLDRSAFYPTSGGQLFDTGWLTAGIGGEERRLPVRQVEERADGAILHFTEGRLEAGAAVHGELDRARRRDHMQQHSGQHVLSAAFVQLFRVPTVSFHMGAESCTIDLETGGLSAKQLEEAERLANEVVLDDRPVEVRFVSPEEAQSLGLRKLPPLAREKLRLIEIQEFDLTACGGTHVRHTGQIGAILLRKTEKVKQGVRVEFVCGARAVATSRRDYRVLQEAAGLYSAHIWELPEQVRKAQEDSRAVRKQQQRVLEELADLQAARLLAQATEEGGFKLLRRSFPDRDAAFLKLLAQKILAGGEPVVALLASTAGQPTLVFAQAGTQVDAGALLKTALAEVGGRGGGTRELAQGGAASAAAAEKALDGVFRRLRE